jgi:hypothetical protein
MQLTLLSADFGKWMGIPTLCETFVRGQRLHERNKLIGTLDGSFVLSALLNAITSRLAVLNESSKLRWFGLERWMLREMMQRSKVRLNIYSGFFEESL